MKVSRPVRRSTSLAAALGVLGVVLGGVALSVSGCSSSEEHGDPCKTTFKGKCGGACTADEQCDNGLYCGLEGVCTADCATGGKSCASGFSCSPRGRCLSTDGLFGVGGGGSNPFGNGTDGGSCVVDRRRGEGLPAAIHIMNDQSQSMSCAIPGGGDRWAAMKSALTSFVQSPEAAGMNVGLNYFGILQGQGDTRGSCNPDTYAGADVEINVLPGNAQPIVDSLNSHGPTTYTPTPAALEGAIRHARDWAIAHPQYYIAVVLATDGQPNLIQGGRGGNQCNNTGNLIGNVEQIARDGYNGNPSIPTFVIGIVGGSAATGGQGCALDPAPPNKPDLDRVAAAGGTNESFIVDATQGNTSAQFLDALNRIRGAAVVPCEYKLPPSTPTQQIDPTKVNVAFTPPNGGAAQPLYQAADAGSCDPQAGGWYYDNPGAPTKIQLCPSTCDIVKSDAKAGIDVLLGCRTQTITPR